MMSQVCAAAIMCASISILAIQDAAPQKQKSASARKAEAEYERSIAAAEKEYLTKVRQAQATLVKELEKALTAATKAGDLDEAVALRDRIKQISETTPALPKRGTAAARDRLAREVADSTWAGPPSWGRFILNPDGSMAYENLKDQTSRWGAMNHEAVGVIDGQGNVSVLVFDPDRRHIKAHYAGQIGKPRWEAPRIKSR